MDPRSFPGTFVCTNGRKSNQLKSGQVSSLFEPDPMLACPMVASELAVWINSLGKDLLRCVKCLAWKISKQECQKS